MTPVHTTDLSDTFFSAWIQAFEDLSMNAMDPLCAAMNESGIMAKAHNSHGNAAGLIQFMPSTLAGLGYKGQWSDFLQLPAEAQVPFVKAFYAPHASSCSSPGLCYVTTFLPALVKDAAAQGSTYVLATDASHVGRLQGFASQISSTLIQAYSWNPGFDRAHKGYITLQDMEDAITSACHGDRWNEIVERYNEAFETLHPSTEPGVPISG
jgi:hypothetical protein